MADVTPCSRCDGTGEMRPRLQQDQRPGRRGEEPAEARPQPSAAAGEEMLPWGTLELLEFPRGKRALRFNAFYNGDPVAVLSFLTRRQSPTWLARLPEPRSLAGDEPEEAT